MFVCSKCGKCCQHIDLIPELSSFDLGNGVCKYLKNNLCEIYEFRPDICRIDVMYKKKYYLTLSLEEYNKMNEQGCKILKNM